MTGQPEEERSQPKSIILTDSAYVVAGICLSTKQEFQYTQLGVEGMANWAVWFDSVIVDKV